MLAIEPRASELAGFYVDSVSVFAREWQPRAAAGSHHRRGQKLFCDTCGRAGLGAPNQALRAAAWAARLGETREIAALELQWVAVARRMMARPLARPLEVARRMIPPVAWPDRGFGGPEPWDPRRRYDLYFSASRQVGAGAPPTGSALTETAMRCGSRATQKAVPLTLHAVSRQPHTYTIEHKGGWLRRADYNGYK